MVAREPGGGRLLLRDIATIVDGFEDIVQYGEFNGEQAMMIKSRVLAAMMRLKFQKPLSPTF